MNWSASGTGRGERLHLHPGASLGQCHSECARIPTRGIIVLSFFEPSFRTRPPTGRRSELWAPLCLPTTDRAPRSWPLRGGFYEWAFWFLLVPSRPSTGFPVSVCFNFSEVAIRAFSSGVAFAQKQKSISVLFFAITQAGIRDLFDGTFFCFPIQSFASNLRARILVGTKFSIEFAAYLQGSRVTNHFSTNNIHINHTCWWTLRDLLHPNVEEWPY